MPWSNPDAEAHHSLTRDRRERERAASPVSYPKSQPLGKFWSNARTLVISYLQ